MNKRNKTFFSVGIIVCCFVASFYAFASDPITKKVNTVFITGANRGIGLELARQYAEEGWKVYATCRDLNHAASLKKVAEQHSNVIVLKLDVRSEQEINDLRNLLASVPIDIVINNAGTLGDNLLLEKVTQKELIDVMNTNAIGPLLVSKALTPNLKLGQLKTLVGISSSLASVSKNNSVDWNFYGYKASKAALNMFILSYPLEKGQEDIRVLLIHPGSGRPDVGSVKTRMGGPDGEIEIKDSALGIRKLVADKKIPSGSFVDYEGSTMPW